MAVTMMTVRVTNLLHNKKSDAMRKTISKHLFLLLAIILAGTGQALAYTDPVLRGDANGDTKINITDVVAVVNRIYNSTFELNDVNADVNGDDKINITDVVAIVNIIYRNSVDISGTIEGWSEGNSADELEPQMLEGDDEEDSNYGD